MTVRLFSIFLGKFVDRCYKSAYSQFVHLIGKWKGIRDYLYKNNDIYINAARIYTYFVEKIKSAKIYAKKFENNLKCYIIVNSEN